MSATGHERRRRFELAKKVADLLHGKDKKKFITSEDLDCPEGMLEARLITLDRPSLESLLVKAETFPAKKRKVKYGPHGS